MTTMNKYWTIVSILIFYYDICCYDLSTQWKRVRIFDNILPTIGYRLTAESRIYCASACAINTSCWSFFYIPGQIQNCRLIGSILAPSIAFSIETGSTYYIKEKVLMPETFSCPPDDSKFRIVLLADGYIFTYRVFKSLATQTQAVQSCEDNGGYLARVTSHAKMKTLLNLTTCPGYSLDDYYVDGSNVKKSGSLYTDWKMLNGDNVPMDQGNNGFWDVGHPNNTQIDHCLRMTAAANHLWQSCDCNAAYFYICEK